MASNVSCAGGVCNRCCTNFSNKRKVSRYELIVCGLACRYCMSRWVKNRSKSGAKLVVVVFMADPTSSVPSETSPRASAPAMH